MIVDQAPPAPVAFAHPDGRHWFRIEYIDGMWEAIWPEEGPRREYSDRIPKVSQVYFIGPKRGPVKIGEATCPLHRLRSLQCGNHEQLYVLATCSGGQAAEREYHRRFASARLHGEWFAPTPEIEAEIARLNDRSEAA